MDDWSERATPPADTRTLQKLRQAALRAAADMASDGMLSMNAAGDIIEANRAAEQMFGYAEGELTGRPVTTLLPERLHSDIRDSLADVLAAGQSRAGHSVELVGLQKTGSEFPVSLSFAVRRSGTAMIMSVVIRDVAWPAQVTRELAEQRTHLEAANQELEAFSYSVSHDLRAPLRSIQGFSRVLLADCHDQLPENGRDALQRICAATERMERLIEAMLALSRVTRSELHEDAVDLSAIVHAVVADLQKQDSTRHVNVVIEEGLNVQGDARLLRVLLENLLDNAWKATAKQHPGRIEFGVTEQHDDREFFVRDNGLGFDPAYAHKLFAPFQTLHRRAEFPGTGVGLATVQRIVKRHGGSVRAEGEPGRGAAFYFALRGVA